MKRFWIVLTAFTFILNLHSQDNENEVYYGKFIRSPWALRLDVGPLMHQMFNPEFISGNVSSFSELTLYYKSFYFNYGVYFFEFSPMKDMTFGGLMIDASNHFYSFNLNMGLGYTYKINENWSSDIKLGFNTTDFEVSNSRETNIYYTSDILMGAQIGIGIDRYIKLRRFNYIVFGLGIDYYSTDYSKVSPQMKPSSLNYMFTIGYQGFFRKMLD
jgi:hypothetical protein